MTENDSLTAQFEAARPRLRAVAYRMLGSGAEADDAVQEAWLHVSRAQASDVRNPNGWLTTVVARVCLDMLRSRRSRREEPLDTETTGLGPNRPGVADAEPPSPEGEAMLADSVGLAMLIVLERLAPAERVAFVLHDMFDLPFEQIAGITGRSPAAARQLASRARRRVRGRVRGAPSSPAAGLARQRQLVEAFLAAARAGDFQALLTVLDPDVELRADPVAAPPRSPLVVTGAAEVARRAPAFQGRARFARLALVDGAPGIVVGRGRQLWTVVRFTVANGKITGIDVIADPGRLARLDLGVMDAAAAAQK